MPTYPHRWAQGSTCGHFFCDRRRSKDRTPRVRHRDYKTPSQDGRYRVIAHKMAAHWQCGEKRPTSNDVVIGPARHHKPWVNCGYNYQAPVNLLPEQSVAGHWAATAHSNDSRSCARFSGHRRADRRPCSGGTICCPMPFPAQPAAHPLG